MNREMKHSGIEWIGNIPSDWRTDILSVLFYEHKLKNKGMVEQNLLSLSYGNIIRKDITQSGGLLPESFETYNIVDKNDIIFRLTDLQNDKRSLRTGLCKERGIITSAYIAIRKRTNIHAPYFHYLFHTYDLCKVFYGLGDGVRQGMNYADMRKLPLIIPSYEEQKTIADFLDKKCSEIDELVALQEKIIEELKSYKQSVITETVCKGLNPNAPMKDSGVEWIGEIPEDWQIVRIKNVAELYGRIGFRGYKSEDLNKEGIGAITLSPSNMKDFYMDYTNTTYLSWEKYYESPEIMINNDDILLVKTGSSYGKVCYVSALPQEATINPQILRVIPKIHNKYLCYILHSKGLKYQIECDVVGGTIPTISQEKINNFFVPLCSEKEQQEIADYLDKKCSEIDQLISIKQQKIVELKDYKKSLIYEYTTGKKRVEA